MVKSLDLEEGGYSLFEGRLYNHDYLWFSSAEVAKVSSTWPVIHNYALSYSLSQYSYGLYKGNYPRYEEDLNLMPLYTTPAIGFTMAKTAITLNSLDDLTLRTDAGGKINTPNLGKRVVVNPCFELPREGRHLKGGYSFFCFTRKEYCPPAVSRLGKKGCPVRVYWRRFESPKAFFREGAVVPAHPVNPLDISGEVVSYEPIVLPPHMLFRRVEIRGDWFVNADGRMVLLPQRIRQRIK
ncbi:MAG: type I-D CRISPR-associated protein Cas5/Csc1 [Dethiobacter sp.]|jgi:CRISPR-associated protein Csc1|nr:MAG: type I-D CRISPR-associated protein Cas5/Csc1 [Dethiobacter sp.]